jgi:type II secretory ATPase GspE/PulE/Tfp pilus assembly ATPase PilB-like protein
VLCELLVPDERIRRLVGEHAGASQIHAAALDAGMESLRRNGLRKVLEGLTTVEEVARVAQEEG